MAELRANAHESLKKMDTSGWAVKKKENHLRNIEVLTAKVAVDTNKLEKASALKRAKTVAAAQGVATVTRAPPMKEAETRRYARRVMDYGSINVSIIKYRNGIWWQISGIRDSLPRRSYWLEFKMTLYFCLVC